MKCPYCGKEVIPTILITKYVTTCYPAKLWKDDKNPAIPPDITPNFDTHLATFDYDSDIENEYECPACGHPLTKDQAFAMLTEDPELLREATENALKENP